MLNFQVKLNITCLLFILPLFVIIGCKDGADAFFSGRPSEMAMVHNRIVSGPPETMVELLKIPFRFPEDSESHIQNWQESIVAWWGHKEKQTLVKSSFSKLSSDERVALESWVGLIAKNRNKEKASTLLEIEAELKAYK